MAYEDLAPSIKVEVNGNELSQDLTSAIVRCEIDLARDVADMVKLTVANPIRDQVGVGYGDNEFVFLDNKAFQPGNDIVVSLGYGDDVEFVGAGVIQKWLPDFPSDGIPTLQIKAYDASVRLMDDETAGEAETFSGGDGVGLNPGQIVLEVIKRHDLFIGRIDPVEVSKIITKKQGMNDYKFLRGLANLVGFDFHVRYDVVSKRWKVYFKQPTSEQTKKYTFRYAAGPESTLLNFQPQWGLRDSPNEVVVLYFDPFTKTWEEYSEGGDDESGESRTYYPGSGNVRSELTSLSRVRIAAGGKSIEYVAERPFRNPEEALTFAKQWFKARRDNFLTGRGTLIGVEDLKVGDVHRLEGLGVQLSGDWEFTTVRHVFDVDQGYTTQFYANKVLTA